MNSISTSAPPPIAHHLKSDPDPPKKVEQAASFQTVMEGEILAPEQSSTGCHGHANELDMDAFFAAWGSTDSHYDVDANGIVDGGDLTILLAGQSDQPMAGSVDDVMQQWGVEGESTADLNADGIVDGADLVMALAGPPTPQESESSEQTEADYPTKLEALLADWGTDAARSDFTGDGIVDGHHRSARELPHGKCSCIDPGPRYPHLRPAPDHGLRETASQQPRQARRRLQAEPRRLEGPAFERHGPLRWRRPQGDRSRLSPRATLIESFHTSGRGPLPARGAGFFQVAAIHWIDRSLSANCSTAARGLNADTLK
jgi:hypothetical protein